MDINEFKKLSVQYEALVGIISKINETKDPVFDEKLKLLLDIEDSIFSKILLSVGGKDETDETDETDEDSKVLEYIFGGSENWAVISELAKEYTPDRLVNKKHQTLLEYSTSSDKRYEKDVLDISDQYQQIEKIKKIFRKVDSDSKISIEDDQLKNKTNDIPSS